MWFVTGKMDVQGPRFSRTLDEDQNGDEDGEDVLRRPEHLPYIHALKHSNVACRHDMHVFWMQIHNLKSDFRGFDFLLFLGIKSESSQLPM